MDRPQPADLPYLPDGNALIERSTDYALNIEYVLAFLASVVMVERRLSVYLVFLGCQTQQQWRSVRFQSSNQG